MDAEKRTDRVSSVDGNTSNTQPCVDNTPDVSTNELQQEGLGSQQDATQTVNGTRKRKLISPAWDHFERIIVNGELKAKCNHCHKLLTGKSSNGTRHLLDHMNTCKMRNNKDIRQQVLSINQSSNLSCHNFDKETSTKDLAEMIILHEYPLVMVEHQGFRKFVRGLQPFFKVPCRNTIKKEILKIYEFEKKKTMRILESNTSRIAITTDMWTSSNQKKGFMAVTAHFIDAKWNMQSRILRFIYVPCPHTSQVLADVLYETLCDSNIDRKLSMVTVDNCTTNDLLMEKLLGKLSLESRLFHMRCCAHILNLIVQDGLSVIGDGIERIRDSVSFWTATPKRIEKFEEAAHHLDIQSSKKLSLDCKTRWNSTYLMLNVAIIYKGVFRRLKTRDAHYNTLPTERDWEVASIICKKLKVFYDVTLLFSGNKYPTTNIFFKSIYEIRYALNQWIEDAEKMIKEMAMKMISKYDKYWKVIHGFMVVAAILDPRYKLKIMEYSFPRLYSNVEDVRAEIESHKDFMYELFKHYQEDFDQNANNYVDSTSNNKNTGNGLFDDYSSYVAEDNTSGSTRLELDHYLEEKVCPPDMDLDILVWWKTNGVKYPMLQKIARDILAIPITTVASESSFSTSGRLVSPHRSRLHPDTLEALMCAQSWLLSEIRETCSKESEAYCQTVNYDYDDDN